MKRFLKNAVRRILSSSSDARVLQSRYDGLLRLSLDVHDELRRVRARETHLPPVRSLDGQETLGVWVLHPHAPWRKLPFEPADIPGMISPEECRYYEYIGRFFSGVGEAVELGPWLGRSTHYIVKGLKPNPRFQGKKLHVFDDFVWRSAWMDRHLHSSARPRNHQDFQFLFDQYAGSLQADMIVQRRKITDHDGNECLPPMTWDDPIEFLYVDCGRTFAANEAWYSLLVRSFIPNRTLIMMQDWRLHREVPVQWYNQTKQFTDSKGAQIELIHELADGGIATFLYRG